MSLAQGVCSPNTENLYEGISFGCLFSTHLKAMRGSKRASAEESLQPKA
jgi:hypothetical protein